MPIEIKLSIGPDLELIKRIASWVIHDFLIEMENDLRRNEGDDELN